VHSKADDNGQLSLAHDTETKNKEKTKNKNRFAQKTKPISFN